MALSRSDTDRYSRQTAFAPLGAAGQERLAAGRAAVIGCGAVGSTIAEILVRAGVGFVRLVDRDVVDLSNLPRQSLFDQEDVARAMPKAAAAAEKLRRINSAARIEPVVAHVGPRSIEHLISEVDLVLDGTDNFAARFLLNDAAVKHGRPWIFGAALAAHGMMMVVRPGRTPCLRCVLGEAPPPGSVPTCEDEGILASTVRVVAALECVEAIKLLTGQADALEKRLIDVDLWAGRWDARGIDRLRGHGHCPACEQGRFEYLDGPPGPRDRITGRSAVQLLPADGAPAVDPAALAARLSAKCGETVVNEWLVRFTAGGRRFTVFADGRAIVDGTDDTAVARGLYDELVNP
jgi:adenylyltransferase/sulfurtransferase